MAKLRKDRDENPELEADFQAKRTARILKTGEFADAEKISTKSFLEERKTKFAEYFETGGFTEMNKFCRQRNIQVELYPDRASLVRKIKKLFPSADCEENDQGVFGVFIPDEVLADSRYKQGRRAETGLVAQHDYEDKNLEEDDFHATDQAEAASDADEDQGPQADNEDDSDGGEASGDGDDEPAPSSCGRSTSKRSSPAVEPTSRKLVGKLDVTPVQRNGSAGSVVSSTLGGSTKRARTASTVFTEDDDGDDDEDKSIRKSARKSSSDKIFEKTA